MARVASGKIAANATKNRIGPYSTATAAILLNPPDDITTGRPWRSNTDRLLGLRMRGAALRNVNGVRQQVDDALDRLSRATRTSGHIHDEPALAHAGDPA